MTTPFFVPPALKAAGVRHFTARAPDPITREWLAEQCEKLERHLRNQYDDSQLPGGWEMELGAFSTAEITGALQRWAFLKHLYRVRDQRLEAAAVATDTSEARDVARQILRRQPVVVELCGHRVEVTSRSYSAMAEIGAHDIRCRELDGDLGKIADLTAETLKRLHELPFLQRGKRNALRRRLRRLSGLYRRILTEREQHRAHLYAHALTPHGGPAGQDEGPPPWWRLIAPEDDSKLLLALYKVGPLRYRRLGQPPPPKRKPPSHREDFGYASLFAHWEPELGLAPGELFDRDLAQTLTAIRAGTLELPESTSPSRN